MFWDLRSRSRIGRPLIGHTSTIYGLAFAADGRMLASSGSNGRIILWDAGTGQRIGSFGLAEYWFSGVAFSADSTRLASGTNQGRILFSDVSIESWRTRACRIANRNLTDEEWGHHIADTRRITCPAQAP